MDFFLGGEFTTYGTDVIAMTQMAPEEREDPMARVFPKMTKCTFHKFGPSGTVEVIDSLETHNRHLFKLTFLPKKFDGLCVLPLNIINEKIYIFLWFWFIGVSIISGKIRLFFLAFNLCTKFIFLFLGFQLVWR